MEFRLTALIGSLLIAGGIAASFGSVYTTLLLVDCFGLCLGMGFTLLFMRLMTVAMQWFPNRKGRLVFGIVSSGTCLSSSLFVPIQTVFINPNNLMPDFRPETNSEFYYFNQSEVLDRVPYSFLLLGMICIILQFIDVTVIVEPENIKLHVKKDLI